MPPKIAMVGLAVTVGTGVGWGLWVGAAEGAGVGGYVEPAQTPDVHTSLCVCELSSSHLEIGEIVVVCGLA